jgi:hypothetical protein
VRGAADARDPLRAEGAVEHLGRRRAVGRHEALRERDHAGAVVHALALELADRVRDALRGDGDEDEVRAVKLVLAVAERPDLEPVGQRDAGQVALVLARALEPRRLFLGAAEQRGADAGAL